MPIISPSLQWVSSTTRTNPIFGLDGMRDVTLKIGTLVPIPHLYSALRPPDHKLAPALIRALRHSAIAGFVLDIEK